MTLNLPRVQAVVRPKPRLPDQYLVYLESRETGDVFMAHVIRSCEQWYHGNGRDEQGRINWTPMRSRQDDPAWERLARLQFRNQLARTEVAL